jgi:hypothetical protein
MGIMPSIGVLDSSAVLIQIIAKKKCGFVRPNRGAVVGN